MNEHDRVFLPAKPFASRKKLHPLQPTIPLLGRSGVCMYFFYPRRHRRKAKSGRGGEKKGVYRTGPKFFGHAVTARNARLLGAPLFRVALPPPSLLPPPTPHSPVSRARRGGKGAPLKKGRIGKAEGKKVSHAAEREKKSETRSRKEIEKKEERHFFTSGGMRQGRNWGHLEL